MKGESNSLVQWLGRHTDAALAIGVIGLVLLLIIPLPPLFLDGLLSLSIALSVIVLLLTLSIENALDFSSFPSVLLFLTLFRLGLNIASTRMILAHGEAGAIIRTFGHFVIQDNGAVGLILFSLLTVINFIVVTKGAGRIAEVAARFTLEALPGKQMAIDSDLSGGVTTQAMGKLERQKLSAEADFYGAMDGASKFVRGDALVSVIMICINLVGGLVIGMGIKGMSWSHCWSTVFRLTIGDGIVSQIPALLVSVGAAMMVTRAANGSLGKAVAGQLFHQPKVLRIAGILLLLLGIIPGMPFWVMVPIGGSLVGIGYFQKQIKKPEEMEALQKIGKDFLAHPIEVLLGFKAASLAPSLQKRLGALRTEMVNQLGIRIPSVHITDHFELSPTGWAILIKGVKVTHGRDAELAALATQLARVIKAHAHELINRQDVASMLHEVKGCNAAVVEELYPHKLSLGHMLKILQSLLKEGVAIRDFVTILETLADHATGEKSDLDHLIERVREALGNKISEDFFGKTRLGFVITLDPKIEQMITASKGALRPKIIDQIAHKIIQLEGQAKKQGVKPVVLTSGSARMQLRKMIEKYSCQLPVLSYKEVASDIELTTVGVVSNEVLI
jgi:flagellar biosynthesis protein FlhA